MSTVKRYTSMLLEQLAFFRIDFKLSMITTPDEVEGSSASSASSTRHPPRDNYFPSALEMLKIFFFVFKREEKNSRSSHCKMCNSNSAECLNFWCGNWGFPRLNPTRRRRWCWWGTVKQSRLRKKLERSFSLFRRVCDVTWESFFLHAAFTSCAHQKAQHGMCSHSICRLAWYVFPLKQSSGWREPNR